MDKEEWMERVSWKMLCRTCGKRIRECGEALEVFIDRIERRDALGGSGFCSLECADDYHGWSP